MDEAMKKLLESLGYVAKGQEQPAGDFVSKADFEAAITKLTESITTAIASVPEMVQKALPAREGQGRRGTLGETTDDVTLETDPVTYLVKKARTAEGIDDALEQALVTALFKQEMERGLKAGQE